VTSFAKAPSPSKKARPSRRRTGGGGDPAIPGRPKADALGGFYAAGPAVALGGAVQRKVTVGKAGDRYESEADAVAERVDRGQAAPEISRLPPGGLGTAQRKTETGEEEPAQEKTVEAEETETEPAQAKSEEEPAQEKSEEEPAQEKSDASDVSDKSDQSEEEPAQAKAEEPEEEPAQEKAAEPEEEPAQAKAAEPEEEPAQAKAEEPEEEPAQEKSAPGTRRRKSEKEEVAGEAIRSRGPGEPLDPGVRGTLEQGMGVDLGGVRVHRDPRAQQAAKGMGARAFTNKKDIWLGPGESAKDTKLMAHEATHVVQQGGVERRKPTSGKAEPGKGAREGAAKAAGGRVPGTAGQLPGTVPGAPARPAPGTSSGTSPGEVAGTTGEVAGTASDGTASDEVAGTPEGTSGEVAGTADEGAPDEAAGTAPAPDEAAGTADEAAGTSDEVAGTPEGTSGEAAGTADEAGGGDAPWIDPGAAAAAEKRKAADRRDRRMVGKKLDAEAKRQEGPAAAPGPRRAASQGASSAASAAAPSPANEAGAMGQAGHAEVMGEQKPGEVDQQSFLELVEEKLRKMDTPSTVEGMKEFKKSGGAQELKARTVGGAREQAAAAQQGIRTAAETEPQPAEPRQPAELQPVPPPPEVRPMGACRAAPRPMAKEEVSLGGSKKHVEERMAEERLSKKRLEKANDPRFAALQGSREEVHEQSNRAPKEFRAAEPSQLAGDRALLADRGRATGQAMQTAQGLGQKKVRGDQHASMSKEEAERRKVSDAIEKKYQAVEKKVRDKLTWLDGEVDRRFDAGEKKARQQFESYVADEMLAWKLRRYGSRATIPVVGAAVAAGTWVYDKVRGIDHFPEVRNIFKDGRDKYLKGLRDTIVAIAGVVEKELAWCQEEIKKARDDIRDYVAGLPEELQKVGEKTAAEVFAKLDDLKGSVEAKKEELADKLVERYKASREKIDARIEEMRAENRGLVEKFVGKLKAVLEAIDNFRKKLLGLLGRARDVIEDILDDPVGFLKNLLKAVKKGFHQFKENILTHLKKGLFGWLFGTLASAGIELPKDFSLKSIVGLLLQVLGITYERMKRKVARILGPRATAVLEKVAGYLATLFREGPAGLWKEIKGDLGDLKEFVLGQIREWVITKIVKAAVTKLVSMFNPAGAIVQAVLTVYNVVMFFVERIDQIMSLVKAVIDALAPIVKGKIAQAANAVEKAMGLTVPVIISFLARLLGLGGVAGKIRKIVKKVQRRVDRAIDKALKRIVAKFKGLVGKGKALGKKALAKGKAAARQLFEWWKMKRKFKSRSGGSHTLFFRGRKQAARLTVASSDPRPVPAYLKKIFKYLKEAKEGMTPEERKQHEPKFAEARASSKKILAAEAEVTKLIEDDKKQKKAAGKKSLYGEETGKKIQAQLEIIAAELQNLPETDGTPVEGDRKVLPPTRITNRETHTTNVHVPEYRETIVSHDGKHVTAEPLSMNPGGNTGGSPSRESFMAESLRPLGYVRAHLLHQRLHGTGREFWNLAPMPDEKNLEMSNFESRVIRQVRGAARVGSYDVKVTYPATSGSSRKIHEVAPTRVDMTYQNMKPIKDVDPTKSKAEIEKHNEAKKDPGYWTPDGQTHSGGVGLK